MTTGTMSATAPAGGTGGEPLYSKRAPLSPSGVLPQAEGKASVVVGLRREEVEVEGTGLIPGAVYKVFADGVEIGSALAQSSSTRPGFLRLRLTGGEAGEAAIPPLLRPITRIRHVEVRDAADRVIMQGDFLPGGGGT